MKRIVICCDGTWNSRDQKYQTNVFKLLTVLEPRSATDVRQISYYLNGVGTGSLIDKLPGGIFGSGLWENVQKAYRYIAEHFDDGDELFLFGFSRGAYTARSVVGMMRKCGILRSDRLDHVETAYDFYRNRDIGPDAPEAKAFRAEHAVKVSQPAIEGDDYLPQVRFIGVWDTVGSLGIPLGILGSIFNRKHRFHDVSLSRIVEFAYHALAIDERRKPFKPTLWEQNPNADKQTLEQHWFAGVHTNVGGGNADSRQSDRALLWMMAKAQKAGLAIKRGDFADDRNGDISPARIHELFALAPFGLLTYVRPIGQGVPNDEATYDGPSWEDLDPAVLDRTGYNPSNLSRYFRGHKKERGALTTASRDVWP